MGTVPTRGRSGPPRRTRRQRLLVVLAVVITVALAPIAVEYVPLQTGQQTTPDRRVSMESDVGPGSIHVFDPTERMRVADDSEDGPTVQSVEWRASTNDIDGDGLSDVEELVCSETYPEADLLEHDIYVEVDSTEGVTVSDQALRRVEETYASARIRDPVGYRGIDLHLRRSDTALPVEGPISGERRPGDLDDIHDYRRQFMDHDDDRYYYLLVTDEVQARGDPYFSGVARSEVGAVEAYDDPNETASLIAHELGHMFGIDEDEPGVDNHTYAFDTYPSVMNYNGLYKTTNYSDGSGELGRDEWHRIAHERPIPEGSCLNETSTG
ncbi:MAG: reprolysin-like metallopeptidase [Halococcoides sp.]